MTPGQRDYEAGREIQHRLVAAAKSYALDPTNQTRFDELMAAGVEFGKRSDLEWAKSFTQVVEAGHLVVAALEEMINDCDRPWENCVRCKAARKAIDGFQEASAL